MRETMVGKLLVGVELIIFELKLVMGVRGNQVSQSPCGYGHHPSQSAIY